MIFLSCVFFVVGFDFNLLSSQLISRVFIIFSFVGCSPLLFCALSGRWIPSSSEIWSSRSKEIFVLRKCMGKRRERPGLLLVNANRSTLSLNENGGMMMKSTTANVWPLPHCSSIWSSSSLSFLSRWMDWLILELTLLIFFSRSLFDFSFFIFGLKAHAIFATHLFLKTALTLHLIEIISARKETTRSINQKADKSNKTTTEILCKSTSREQIDKKRNEMQVLEKATNQQEPDEKTTNQSTTGKDITLIQN